MASPRATIAIVIIALLVTVSASLCAVKSLGGSFAGKMFNAVDNLQPGDLEEGSVAADPPSAPSDAASSDAPASDAAATTEPVVCEHPPTDCPECKEKLSECSCTDCGKN